jgi:ribosomal subunit interface protein
MATIVVTGRDSEITSRNKQHAEEKLARLERFHDGITKIEAVLGHGSDGAEAELVISVRRRKPIVCHGKAKELYAAIDLVLDKAEGQLTKVKERSKAQRTKRRSGQGSGSGSAGASDEDESLESYEDIVEKTDFSQ